MISALFSRAASMKRSLEVFPDIVQVAFHGADDHGAQGDGLFGHHQGFEDIQRAFHGTGAQQQVGHEGFAAFKIGADSLHGGTHGPVNDVLGGLGRIQRCLDRDFCLRGHSPINGFVQFVHLICVFL